MNPTVIYIVNAIIALGLLAGVTRGFLTWQVASAIIAAMLTPSAAHVALTPKDDAPPEAPKP